MIPKIGDKVICRNGTYIGDHKPNSIETIKEIANMGALDVYHIIVSNTNDDYWILGRTWELYTIPKNIVGGHIL